MFTFKCKCGNEVQRSENMKRIQPVCFECKQKRQRINALKHKKYAISNT